MLADYTPQRRVIELKVGSFEVRGLTLDDITTLVTEHLPTMEAVFDTAQNNFAGKAEITNEDMVGVAVELAQEAPGFVAELIARAADEPGEIAKARSLPAPIQIKALVEIAELTFEEVGGVKNAFESVAGLLKASPKLQSMMEKLAK